MEPSPLPTSQDVLSALRAVSDDQVGKDVVSAGYVKNLFVDGTTVRFELHPASVDGSDKSHLKAPCEAAVKALPGVDAVEIDLKNIKRTPRAPRAIMNDVKHVVAVASGKGGVGKSTVTANLALALSREGYSVGLLDADIYGPSMPTMFGTHERPKPAGDKRIHPVEAQGVKIMSIGFVVDPDQPMVWRGPMVHGALQQFLEQVEWGELDFVLVDMPPGTGDAQLTLTQKAPLSGAIIVSTPQQVALIDARKGLKMFQQVKVPVLGIVENMSYLVGPDGEMAADLFGRGGAKAAAEELGVPFLGEVPLQEGVAQSGDEGEPIVVRSPDSPAAQAFQAAARTLARTLMISGEADASLSMNWQS